ncbi:MAG: hypothetical protein KDJ50_00690 [Alphaproteobacteria bacterium]|nr:hypothetical protein [Alphaproteobacteria bacterium]
MSIIDLFNANSGRISCEVFVRAVQHRLFPMMRDRGVDIVTSGHRGFCGKTIAKIKYFEWGVEHLRELNSSLQIDILAKSPESLEALLTRNKTVAVMDGDRAILFLRSEVYKPEIQSIKPKNRAARRNSRTGIRDFKVA